MTTYRLMDGASGRPGVGSSGTTPPGVTSYSGPFQAGTLFCVTQGGMWFQGFWWWAPSGSATGDLSARKFCLWQLSGSGTGTLVPGTTVTSGTLTAGAWNYVALGTPVQLSIGGTGGSAYIAATGWTAVNGFPDSNSQFATGDPYATGITNGPLTAYGDATAGGTPASPFSFYQGLFGTGNTGGAADPTLNMPAGGSSSSNFWIDVQVSDTAPSGYSGSYRIWPNKFDVKATGTGTDAADNYSLGTEFTLSAACTLNSIWFYSPSGATQLPTQCAIWNVSTTAVVSGTLNTSPSWSGAAGSGWVSCSYSGVTLPAGDYKTSVWNGNASPSGFNEYTLNYFTTGAGASGITTGPVSVPDATSATSPGQSTYQTSGSSFLYPNQYVATEGQSYWVDVEVTPVTEVTVAGAAATAALAAPAGSVTAGGTAGGAVAPLALAAPAGTVHAGAVVAGAAAGLTFAAPAGTVQAGAVVAGAVAPLALAAPAGTASSTAGAAGIPATVALAAQAGTVQAGAVLAGAAAPLALAAPAGAAAAGAVIAGAVAGLTLAAPAGSVTTGAGASGVPAGLAFAAPAGTVHAGAVVAGAPARLALAAPAGSVPGSAQAGPQILLTFFP